MENRTIAAISTYPGKSALGIIRVSGRDTFSIISKIVRFSSGMPISEIPPRTQYLAGLYDHFDSLLDKPLVTVFKAPNSYTGEDMAEISCHGSILILQSAMEALCHFGAQSALPGEFTKRAFLNNKMDLAQAEAVADIIDADSKTSLKLSLSQLEGNESGAITALREKISSLLSLLELEIDFAHEDTPKLDSKSALSKLSLINADIGLLLKNADLGIMIKNGVRCVIAGKPNAGKSSVMNALLRKNRAIVTGLAGTTRDVIEDRFDLENIPVRLFDTAGIRHAETQAEKEGVHRAKTALKEADIILFIVDGSLPLTNEDIDAFKETFGRQVILCINKSDLEQKIAAQDAKAFLGADDTTSAISINCVKEDGIIPLTNALKNIIIGSGHPALLDGILVTNLRHKQALLEASTALKDAGDALAKNLSFEFAASDIKRAAASLGSITGVISTDEILESIFSGFCIGK
ncbi:MAG: tRNA uridine-5-carboxymethylaminomethyl(34) synthesis GTPase MnmE [Candidatus Goldiibacteriota bacterium HGW-Goldbacteria-1]|jgi:tRNA modification GTPase|nr:MAG: tRNA uridine-5-carboxymethylaminomethyl(34) synthesis GTPase MnmE [Candidatus Goldiibacteriota bacterium HGW-Goldbacteria-1]